MTQAVTVDRSHIFISKDTTLSPRNIAGHEAFHLWKSGTGRDSYIEILEDNLLFSSEAFREYQTPIAEAYLGGEADLANDAQMDKMREEIFTITIIEGNKGKAVARRTLAVNGRYIRGYCLPDYASKAKEESGMNQEQFDAMMEDYESRHALPVPDNTPADWEKDGVAWAVKNGIMSGDGAGNLMLHSPLTRAQFVVMLKRYHDAVSQ